MLINKYMCCCADVHS